MLKIEDVRPGTRIKTIHPRTFIRDGIKGFITQVWDDPRIGKILVIKFDNDAAETLNFEVLLKFDIWYEYLEVLDEPPINQPKETEENYVKN